MPERNPLVPVMALAIVNGIFSPWVLAVFVFYPVWYPGWAPPYTQIVYMLSALILSTLTIMVSGVPAALYARLSSAPRPAVSGLIWIAGAALLTLPAVPNVLRALGFSS
jgi:hypothetical protein